MNQARVAKLTAHSGQCPQPHLAQVAFFYFSSSFLELLAAAEAAYAKWHLPFPPSIAALHSHCANSDCTHSACCSCIYVRASRLRNMPNKPRYISAKSKNKHRAMKYNICMAFVSVCVCECVYILMYATIVVARGVVCFYLVERK